MCLLIYWIGRDRDKEDGEIVRLSGFFICGASLAREIDGRVDELYTHVLRARLAPFDMRSRIFPGGLSCYIHEYNMRVLNIYIFHSL